MKLIIDIPENYYEKVKSIKPTHYTAKCYIAIQNGILLDTHDEEVIRATVHSIWGKNPDMMIDNIKTEISNLPFINGELEYNGKVLKLISADAVMQIIEKCDEESEEL